VATRRALFPPGQEVCLRSSPRRHGVTVVVEETIRDTVLAFGRKLSLFSPRSHFQRYDAVGLVAAARRCQRDLRAGGDIETGRAELRRLLQQQTPGEPAVRVSTSARSTLNALAGGYAHPINRQGTVAEEPADGIYRLLMESVESFLAMAQVVGDAQPENWARGRKIRAALQDDLSWYRKCHPQPAAEKRVVARCGPARTEVDPAAGSPQSPAQPTLMSPNSLDQSVYRIVVNRREADRLTVTGG
jgi:hypothetical protein